MVRSTGAHLSELRLNRGVALTDILALRKLPSRDRVSRSISWLLDAQSAEGWWTDFLLAPGRSDEWVTGYVAANLADARGVTGQDEAIETAIERAWSALAGRSAARDGGGWAYNRFVPRDSDSTAWALRCALAAGRADDPQYARALDGFGEFVSGDGVATYGKADPIRMFIGADEERSFAGWTAPHACVTAAAAQVPQLRPVVLEALHRMQAPDGSWSSYWWASTAYASALACRAVEPTERKRVGEWGADQRTTSAFDLAGLLSISVDAGRSASERDARADELAQQQLPDGSFAGSALLRVPDPHQRRPEDVSQWTRGGRVEGAEVVDDRRIFTTATAVSAWARHLRSR